MARTIERNEMLSDILCTALSGIRYYAEIIEYAKDGHSAIIRPYEDYEDGVTEYPITLDTVARGLRRLADGTVTDYAGNSGYSKNFRSRMISLYRDKGPLPDEDYDAIDADNIVQAGLFGAIVYG